jgi:hypothetical protein
MIRLKQTIAFFVVSAVCVLTISISALAGSVPDRAKTRSYTNTSGEDSDNTISPPSYTKLDAWGNALDDSAPSWCMVKDNVTGFIWENKTDDGSIHDKDNIYTWDDAQGVFIKNLNDNCFGGFSDWRLPTIKELSSIVNRGTYNPAVNTAYFPHTMSSAYWSPTTSASQSDNAWYVYFYDGSIGDNDKSGCYYVRAVRGGESGAWGDSIMVNQATGLITTECGETATFTIALAGTAPTAEVTITISSSDSTEGTVSPASLTFTPDNWSTQQTVTVIGIDDGLYDGDVAYPVITCPAVSDDPVYNDVDPDDVLVTNRGAYYKDADYKDADGNVFGLCDDKKCLSAPKLLYTTAAVCSDCDDTRKAINPAAVEICDGKDNDCDGQVDEDVCTIYYKDFDKDTYGVDSDTKCLCKPTVFYTATKGGDCNDNNAAINPGAEEICDGKDNDCDGQVDEDVTTIYYKDFDKDGYGVDDDTKSLCKPTGFYTATQGGDCNDSNAAINPAAVEICDGKDNDCDGQVDEDVTTIYYKDFDKDGYGVDGDTKSLCQPTGFYTATKGGDCNDSNAAINLGTEEICDGKDNDCDGQVDEDVTTIYYKDFDKDGYGVDDDIKSLCQPTGFYTATQGGDCNDADAAINLGTEEICDGKDNDCDGQIDEGVTTIYYKDFDKDGYGVDGDTRLLCQPTVFYTATKGGDCNDADAAINLGTEEICDGKDNDCDGQVDEGVTTIYYKDFDKDTYGVDGDTRLLCQPTVFYRATQGGDCNDADAATYPGAVEICDDNDNDCDGQIDEGCNAIVIVKGTVTLGDFDYPCENATVSFGGSPYFTGQRTTDDKGHYTFPALKIPADGVHDFYFTVTAVWTYSVFGQPITLKGSSNFRILRPLPFSTGNVEVNVSVRSGT